MRDRLRRARGQIIAAVVVVAVGVGGGSVYIAQQSGGGGSPVAGEAHLWVDTTGGTCARSSSPAEYSDAAACSSPVTACAAASAGDTVRIKEGDYSGFTLGTGCGGTSGNRITFDAENGAAGCDHQMIFLVTEPSPSNPGQYNHTQCPVHFTGSVNMTAHDVNFKNFSVAPPTTIGTQGIFLGSASTVATTANRVTLTNSHSQILHMTGSDLVAENGEVAGMYICSGPGQTYPEGQNQQQDLMHIGFHHAVGTGDRITVDGMWIHDLTDRGYFNGNYDWGCGQEAAGPHTDCFQSARRAHDIIIRNSRWWNCGTAAIIARPGFFNGIEGTMQNWTVENNFFGRIYDAGNAALIGAHAFDTVGGSNVFRYNTSTSASTQLGTGTFTVTGNVFIHSSSASMDPPGATFSYNTFSVDPRGTNAKTCTPTFAGANTTATGYQLSASDTCAKDAGNPSNYPAFDLGGASRFLGSAPDAGAHEAG